MTILQSHKITAPSTVHLWMNSTYKSWFLINAYPLPVAVVGQEIPSSVQFHIIDFDCKLYVSVCTNHCTSLYCCERSPSNPPDERLGRDMHWALPSVNLLCLNVVDGHIRQDPPLMDVIGHCSVVGLLDEGCILKARGVTKMMNCC